jgi:hypothetical protein
LASAILRRFSRPKGELNYSVPPTYCWQMAQNLSRPTVIVGMGFVLLIALSVTTVASAEAQPFVSPSPSITTGGSCCVAGYSGNVTAGTTFSFLEAQWNVPAVTCQPTLAGGQQVVTIVQANRLVLGIEALCKSGSSSPTLAPFAYFPPVNSNPVPLKLKVKAGDSIYAVFIINPGDSVNGTLRDMNTATSVHYVKVVPGASKTAQGFFIGTSRGGLGLFSTTYLAKFGTPIKFEGCLVNVNPISSSAFLSRIAMVDGSSKVMAQTSALSGSGTIFSVSWVRSA